MRLTRIRRYPVKSCRGWDVASAAVLPWGLVGDRRWMLVDPDGVVVTARECHRLLLVEPELTAYGLRLTAPDTTDLQVREPTGAPVMVQVWSSAVPAVSAGPEAQAWFTAVAGRPLQLVYLADPYARATDPRFSTDADRVSFADGFPLLLTTEASLAALNDAILDRYDGAHEPLPMERFRPNLVIAGSPAWAEDDWRRVRVGGATFRVVKGCARCVLTTLDPTTAEAGKEPIATLAQIRRFDGKTWFGVNLVPDTPGVSVAVGDDVRVLDAVLAGAGPVR